MKKKSDFITYVECVDYVNQLHIETKQEYIKIKHPKNIPTNPNIFYSEWLDWGTFLRGEQSRKSIDYYSYIECKEKIKEYNINSKTKWFKEIYNIIKNDEKIPYNPFNVYKKEFIGWGDFLNTGRIQDNKKQYLSFEETKQYIKLLNINSRIEWRLFCKTKPIYITSKPNIKYKNEWKGWSDFFGCIDKISKGELNIIKILKKYNIKYICQKRFNNCRNVYPLPFDFYLIDFNLCLEFDGRQHHEPVDIFGGDIEFKKRQINDKIKDNYCLNNNIKLLRFSVKDDIENILKEVIQF